MLVPNQRFENLPNCRAPNGTQLDNVKELNNRIFINSTLEFGVPQFNLINIEDIDAVLISNYNSMLALPYLRKMSGVRATIYCTEPVMQFGKMLMEELTHFIKYNQSISSNMNRTNENKGDKTNEYPLFRTLQHLSIKINKKSDNAETNLTEKDKVVYMNDDNFELKKLFIEKQSQVLNTPILPKTLRLSFLTQITGVKYSIIQELSM